MNTDQEPLVFAGWHDSPGTSLCDTVSYNDTNADNVGIDLISVKLADRLEIPVVPGSEQRVDIRIIYVHNQLNDSYVEHVEALIADISVDLALQSIRPARSEPEQASEDVDMEDAYESPGDGDDNTTSPSKDLFVFRRATVHLPSQDQNRLVCTILIQNKLDESGEHVFQQNELYGVEFFQIKHAIIHRELPDEFPGRVGRTLQPPREHNIQGMTVKAEYAIELVVQCGIFAFLVDASIVRHWPEDLGIDRFENPIVFEYEAPHA